MSEYTTVEIEIPDTECLIKALEEMGYKPIVSLDKAIQLIGYRGDTRLQKAHIVIPRSQISSASNDIGFEMVDGKYIAHISEYDRFFKVNKLKQLYGRQKLKKMIKLKASKYSIKSETVDINGDIKIKIKIRG